MTTFSILPLAMIPRGLLPSSIWITLAQAFGGMGSSWQSYVTYAGNVALLGAGATVIYRLGRWQQVMENSTQSVAAQVETLRRGWTARFDRIEGMVRESGRLVVELSVALKDVQAATSRTARWQGRTNGRLERLEQLRNRGA